MDLNCLIKSCDVDLQGHELLDKSNDLDVWEHESFEKYNDVDGSEHEFPKKNRGLTRWGQELLEKARELGWETQLTAALGQGRGG